MREPLFLLALLAPACAALWPARRPTVICAPLRDPGGVIWRTETAIQTRASMGADAPTPILKANAGQPTLLLTTSAQSTRPVELTIQMGDSSTDSTEKMLPDDSKEALPLELNPDPQLVEGPNIEDFTTRARSTRRRFLNALVLLLKSNSIATNSATSWIS